MTRYSISATTVATLVLLRLVIGWHFFSEGVKHYTDPHWTSEPVLRGAKGPLAGMYRGYVPDFHRFDELMHGSTEKDGHAATTWIDQIQEDWDTERKEFVHHFGFDEKRAAQTSKVFNRFRDKLRSWADDRKDALATHVHEWHEETTRERPASDVPFQKKRIAEKQGSLNGEAAGWMAEIKAMEADYRAALENLLAPEELSMETPRPKSSIDRVDRAMTFVILGVGLLLLLGLFTRAACVAGAIFLFSVVSMQPFWVADAAPTFNQCVEMFALLALATTEVGRWAGLDYFLTKKHNGSSPAMKG